MLYKYMEVKMKILKIDTFRIDEDDDLGSEDPERDDEPVDDDWD